jgi:hypothetical protein
MCLEIFATPWKRSLSANDGWPAKSILGSRQTSGLDQDFNSLDAQYAAAQAYTDRKITVVEQEAKTVRHIFRR